MAKAKSSTAVTEATALEVPEGYTVLARRYRPRQFTDLVGQQAIARSLLNALKTNRVAHAYLFTGARGVGKTSTARILAKALNCVQGPTATPCDACDICRSIAAGEDVDVLEIDGASNRGIDEVREIRNNVQYRPSRAKYKIYIIDEVHMLTPAAFNALLKTLEEPPSHVKFIFATTEVQRIPVTILSRCQRFDFGGISPAMIVERLRDIVAQEGMQADEDALELVARRSGGSMRDAQSLLDQLLAFGNERLTADQVHQLLGTAQDERILALADAILSHDAPRALDLLAQALLDGLQLGELLDQLIWYWRDLMVLQCTQGASKDLHLPSRHQAVLAKQAALPLDTILAGLDILNSARSRLRGSNHGRVLIEMAVVRLARLEDLVPISQLTQWLSQPAAVPQATRPAAARLSDSAEGVKKKPPATAETALRQSFTPLTEESLAMVWPQVLTQTGPILGGNLEKAGFPAISAPNSLVLRFPVSYNSQREYCQEPTRLQRIEEVTRKITGQLWLVRMEARGDDVISTSSETPAAGVSSPSRTQQKRAEVLQEPLLKRAIDVLGAQIVHVDDGFGAAPVSSPLPVDISDGEES